MNRVIKFRCWNPTGQCMHGWKELVQKNKIHLIAQNNASYPIMQFTGLLDSNGVEVYEGDLVSIHDSDDNEFLMSGVVKFGVRGYPAFDIYNGLNDTYTDEYNTFTNDDNLKFTVFGNIYQNPELLK